MPKAASDNALFFGISGSVLVLILFLTTLFSWQPIENVNASPFRQEPIPQPDRLAIPVLPDNPTPLDKGRVVYYYHCMPCHGDVGQGLTDEWRQVWVEDHRNCWARGCHGGREGDEGFPLPKTIPAVIQPPQGLSRFTSLDDLSGYLKLTHPPQRPGKLSDDDYQTVSYFLMSENGRLPAENVLTNEHKLTLFVGLMLSFSLLFIAFIVTIAFMKRSRSL